MVVRRSRWWRPVPPSSTPLPRRCVARWRGLGNTPQSTEMAGKQWLVFNDVIIAWCPSFNDGCDSEGRAEGLWRRQVYSLAVAALARPWNNFSTPSQMQKSCESFYDHTNLDCLCQFCVISPADFDTFKSRPLSLALSLTPSFTLCACSFILPLMGTHVEIPLCVLQSRALEMTIL